MNCKKCNTFIPNEASFCPSCGFPVGRTEMNDKKKRKGCKRIFIIVLSVFLILCIVFAAIVIAALNAASKAERKTELAMIQIKLLDDALQQYKFDVGYYPSDLQCLVENIDKADKWNGPYIMPNVPRDPWNNEYQYLVPGDYGDFDIYPFGMGNNGGGSITDVDLGKQWKERMIAESKGELDMSKGRDFYDSQIVLPDNQVFGQMAKREALGQQYDKLRQAGWSQEQISNCVMREKYLPLVRLAIGRPNVTGYEKMTSEQWGIVKKEMIKRQLRGVKNNLNKVDSKTGLSNSGMTDFKYDKVYEDALSLAWDARVKALRNGKNPDTVEIHYSDVIKNNPAMQNAVTRASMNSW